MNSIEQLTKHSVNFSGMSGGEQAKLKLAMYFAMAEIIQPRLFLIDEPYNHLDDAGKDAVREVLKSMKKENIFSKTTVMIVTHDDNNDLHLPNYDKVLALLPQAHSVGYYGEVGQISKHQHAATGYYAWLSSRANATAQQPQHVAAHHKYPVAM